jgi:hypothetical protein
MTLRSRLSRIVGGESITRRRPWRTIGRPEAALVGVGLFRNNRGAVVGAWKVADVERWPWSSRA